MSPIQRWNDERLDELSAVAKLTATQAAAQAIAQARTDVTVEAHTQALARLTTTLDKLDDKLDNQSAQFRLTPGQKLAAAVPIVGSVATMIAVVLAGGPG